MTENGKHERQELYKWLAVASLSVLMGMGIQVIRTPGDVVQERELNQRLLELQAKIDTQTAEISALRQSVNQQNTDIAGIAAKVGVTAHPVTAPGIH